MQSVILLDVVRRTRPTPECASGSGPHPADTAKRQRRVLLQPTITGGTEVIVVTELDLNPVIARTERWW